jgi:hypothetical protein
MPISQLYPEGRPSISANFARTKRIPPEFQYSRASTGTYVGSDGLIKTAGIGEPRFDCDPLTGDVKGLLIEESRTNYLRNSQLLATSPWGITNLLTKEFDTIAPDGTFTGTSLIATAVDGNHRIFMTSGGVSSTPLNTTFIFTGYFKYNGHRYVSFNCNINQGTYGHFDLLLGVANVGSITNIGNGWYRCQSTLYPAAPNNINNTLSIALTTSSSGFSTGGLSFLGDGVSGIYAWGLQSEAGNSSTSYIPTPATFTSRASTATFYDSSGIIQTAAINTARSNAFFPDSSGVMRPAGLLLEAAGTNSILYSEQFDDTYWTPNGNIVGTRNITSNQITSPDGLTTANLLTVSSVTDEFCVGTGARTGVAASTTATFSVFVKAKELSRIALAYWDSGAGYRVLCYFNASLGSFYSVSSSVIASSEKLSNEWFRIRATFTSTSVAGNAFTIAIANPNNSTSSLVFNGTSFNGQGLYIWGAQLETGSYASSYISTTASAVTRSADVSSSSTVTKAADTLTAPSRIFLNQPKSSIVVKTESTNPESPVLSLNDGTTFNETKVIVYPNAGTWKLSSNDIVRSGLVLNLDSVNSNSYSGSGTAWTDLSGFGNNGSLINGVGYNSSNFGSLSFDGVNDYVNVPNSSSLQLTNNMTVSIWFMPFNFSSTRQGLIGRNGLNEYTITLEPGGGISFYFESLGQPANYYNGASSRAFGQENNVFQQVTITRDYDNNIIRIYKNSVQTGTNFQSLIGLAKPTASSGPTRIADANGGYYNGRVSQVLLYNRALSLLEIQQNFNITRSRYGI